MNPRPTSLALAGFRFVVVFFGGVATSLLAADSPDAAAGRLRLDIPYVEAGDPLQVLDLRLPEGNGPFPVVVLVHGGGWSGGDKSGADKPGSGADITPWFAPLEHAGFLVVSINYRLAPAHRWPACLEDTRAAVAWVAAHIAEHGGDPARVAILGHSAGGHLAFFAAMPVEGVPAPVRAAVGCAAVSDLVSDTVRRGGPSTSLQALFALSAETTPETLARLAEVSPLQRVTAAFPPTLLLHGEADKTVPIAQSLAFQARLHELGVRADLHVLPGAGHRLTEWDAHDPAWARVLTDWLHARLGAVAPTSVLPINDDETTSLHPRAFGR
jgi:alpha-L-fucosidase 2